MRILSTSLMLIAASSLVGCTTYVDTDGARPVVVETPRRDKVDIDVKLPPTTAERPQRKVDVDINAPGVNVDVKR